MKYLRKFTALGSRFMRVVQSQHAYIPRARACVCVYLQENKLNTIYITYIKHYPPNCWHIFQTVGTYFSYSKMRLFSNRLNAWRRKSWRGEDLLGRMSHLWGNHLALTLTLSLDKMWVLIWYHQNYASPDPRLCNVFYTKIKVLTFSCLTHFFR